MRMSEAGMRREMVSEMRIRRRCVIEGITFTMGYKSRFIGDKLRRETHS